MSSCFGCGPRPGFISPGPPPSVCAACRSPTCRHSPPAKCFVLRLVQPASPQRGTHKHRAERKQIRACVPEGQPRVWWQVPQEEARATGLMGCRTVRADPASDPAEQLRRHRGAPALCGAAPEATVRIQDTLTPPPLARRRGLKLQRAAEEGDNVKTTPSCLEKGLCSLERSYLTGTRQLIAEKY